MQPYQYHQQTPHAFISRLLLSIDGLIGNVMPSTEAKSGGDIADACMIWKQRSTERRGKPKQEVRDSRLKAQKESLEFVLRESTCSQRFYDSGTQDLNVGLQVA